MITTLSENASAHDIAHDYIRNQLFREAIVVLGDAVDFQATDEQLWVDLAFCYRKIQRSELARNTLEKGLKHNPGSQEISFALIRMLIERAKWGEALVVMRSCEKDLIKNISLFAEYCDLLWESEQIVKLEAVLSRWSEEIYEEPFCVFYKTKILLMQQRGEDAANILADFLASNPITQKFTDLFEEVCDQLFPNKFPWIIEYEPALLHRLSKVIETLPHEAETNLGIVLLTIKLALVEKQYEKAKQAIDHARQLGAYCESESFQSSIDYYADLCTIVTSGCESGLNKPMSLLENHANDIDSVMASFLYYWERGMEEKWLHDVEDLAIFSERDDSPILWCLKFIREHGQLGQALIVAELWQSLYPHAIQAAIQVTELLADLGRNSEANAGIQEILRQEAYIADDKRTLLVKIALKLQDFSLLEKITTPEYEVGKLSLKECVNYYRLLMGNGKFEECIEVLRTCQGSNNEEEILLRNLLCDAYYYAKQLDAGINILNQSEEILGVQAESLIMEEKFLETKEPLPKDLLFHTTSASVFLRLAVLHREAGNIQNVASCIEKAYGLAPDHPICQYALQVCHNQIVREASKVAFCFSQVDMIENLTDRDGNVGNFFGELLKAERIQTNSLEDGVDTTALSNVKTAKLFYALLSPSDKFLTLCPPKVEEFSARIMREISLGDCWNPEYRENSTFLALGNADLWFLREKELSHFLPYRQRMAQQNLEQYPTSASAWTAYHDAVIRAYFWQTFLSELGIQADQSTKIDESFIKAMFDQAQPDSLDDQIQLLWAWFQAIRSNQVILVDNTLLEQFTDDLFAYYLVAVRKTNTKIHLQQLTERADSNNYFLLLQLAFSMIELGDNKQALEIVKSFPTDLPDDPILHCVIARVCEANHLLGKAIYHLDTALEQYWHVTEWHEWMAGWAYEYEDTAKAVKHLEVLYEQKQSNYDIAVLLAHSYLKDKRINKAKKLLDQLIKGVGIADEGDRDDIEALKVIYFALKKDLDMCNRYLTGKPCNSPLLRDAYLATTNLAAEQGKSDLAMRYVQIAYGYQPSHHATLITLTKVLIALHHIHDARKILNQVDMSINPSLCFEKIKLLETVSDEDHFSEQLHLAHDLFPQHPGIMYRLARYFANTGNEQKASELLGTLFAHIKPTVEQLMFAGELHLKLGNLDKAISYMSDVIQNNPDNTKAYLSLASAYVHQRQYNTAMDVYEHAIAQQPDDHQAYYQAGILLRDLKRFQEAESFLKKAVKLAPNNWDIRNQLGAVMALNFVDHHH